MDNKEYLRKIYRQFSHFVEEASSRELGNFIMDARYTSMFNYRMRNLVEEINREGKDTIGISLIFNTEGEIALIDADIIGKYIADNYKLSIEESYKNASLNKIIKMVVNGTDKTQRDFVAVSYTLIYNCLQTLYKEIKYRKDIGERLKREYELSDYGGEDTPIVITSLLIVEDICRYIGVKTEFLLEYVKQATRPKKI